MFENEEKNGIVDEIVTPNVNYYNGFTSPTQQNLEIKTSNNVVNYYYKRNSYNLTIVTNSEIGEKQIYVKYNTNLESINQVSKESYSFGGYFTNENLTNQITHMPAYDTKVYVWWQEETKPTAFNYDKEYTSIVISGYIGNDSNVNVPSYIGGLPVNRILSLYSSKIINLTLPDTLTYVGSLNGERPHIPDYDYYGNFPLFSECNIYIKNLETITNLTIGDNVGSGFKGCKLYINNELLTELTISRTNILFYGYNYLKKVTISNAINITASAFMECKELTDVIINGNIETISNSAFSYCSKLTNVIINGYVKETDSFSFMKTALYNVPNGIQKIGTYAFSECENLTNIVLPNSITTIDDYAFADCSNLTSITIPNSVNDMGETIFKNCTNLNFVSVPFVGESRTDTEGRFYKLFERKWSANLQTYYYLIPDSLSKVAVTDAVIIPDNAFSIIYCNIDTVILNEGIESIGESAFSCVGNGLNFGIKNVVIPQSVKNIEPWCFSHSETSVFYCGTKTQWEELEALSSVVYFYTETLIENENKYWHYVNDEITIWE